MSDFESRLRALEQQHAQQHAEAALPGVVLIVRMSGMTDDQIAAAADAKARGVPLILIEERDMSLRAPTA